MHVDDPRRSEELYWVHELVHPKEIQIQKRILFGKPQVENPDASDAPGENFMDTAIYKLSSTAKSSVENIDAILCWTVL
ncbi:hypothetical protein AVEN_132344-1 [Araneus ventricosus]|uniref:Uncharacterized protein n=2 Tax=Araneus ventricosus TaxID=182803 RepID=A0A4Y2U069_ARAVE|nr:hypothetical protein AVEN_155450-1 [Araneus ventricosus]GBO06268.1 hypothetical protein AVEN_132344-1 [Araneus ventricosus]